MDIAESADSVVSATRRQCEHNKWQIRCLGAYEAARVRGEDGRWRDVFCSRRKCAAHMGHCKCKACRIQPPRPGLTIAEGKAAVYRCRRVGCHNAAARVQSRTSVCVRYCDEHRPSASAHVRLCAACLSVVVYRGRKRRRENTVTVLDSVPDAPDFDDAANVVHINGQDYAPHEDTEVYVNLIRVKGMYRIETAAGAALFVFKNIGRNKDEYCLGDAYCHVLRTTVQLPGEAHPADRQRQLLACCLCRQPMGYSAAIFRASKGAPAADATFAGLLALTGAAAPCLHLHLVASELANAPAAAAAPVAALPAVLRLSTEDAYSVRDSDGTYVAVHVLRNHWTCQGPKCKIKQTTTGAWHQCRHIELVVEERKRNGEPAPWPAAAPAAPTAEDYEDLACGSYAPGPCGPRAKDFTCVDPDGPARRRPVAFADNVPDRFAPRLRPCVCACTCGSASSAAAGPAEPFADPAADDDKEPQMGCLQLSDDADLQPAGDEMRSPVTSEEEDASARSGIAELEEYIDSAAAGAASAGDEAVGAAGAQEDAAAAADAEGLENDELCERPRDTPDPGALVPAHPPPCRCLRQKAGPVLVPRYWEEHGYTGPLSCWCGSRCPKCGSPWQMDALVHDREVLIIGRSATKIVNVYAARCSLASCSELLRWDGDEDQLLRFSDGHALCYEVVADWLSAKQQRDGQLTLSIMDATIKFFFHLLQGTHSLTSSAGYTKHLHYAAFWHSLASASIDYSKAFCCPVCGDFSSAKIVISDGCTVGFEFVQLFHGVQQQRARPLGGQAPAGRARRAGSKFARRVCIESKEVRDLLLRWCGAHHHARHDPNKGPRKPLSPQEFGTLKGLAPRWLLPLLDAHAAHEARCPEPWAAFLSQLARDHSFALGTVKDPAGLRPVLARLGTGQWLRQADEAVVDATFPSLRALQQHEDSAAIFFDGVPDYARPLFLHLADRCDALAGVDESERHAGDDPGEWIPVSEEEGARRGFFFPGAPYRRARAYKKETRSAEGLFDGCFKGVTKHPTRVPGIFAVFCTHGICLGFEVMFKFESPQTLFSAVFQRRRTAPLHIVYDNACHALEYALNREPAYFKDTNFWVETFHSRGHVCSEGFRVKLFPQYADIRGPVCEQAFSFLQRVRPSAAKMGFRNFMLYMKYAFARYSLYRRRQVHDAQYAGINAYIKSL